MYSTSGFFADDYEDKDAALDKYSEMILDAIPECDYLSAVAPKKVYIPYFLSITHLRTLLQHSTTMGHIRELKQKKPGCALLPGKEFW